MKNIQKKLTLFFTVIFIFCFSCNEKHEVKLKTKEVKSINKIAEKKFCDFISDKNFTNWVPKHADTTGYLCQVTFDKDFVVHLYHGQCAYYYFTYKTGEKTFYQIWSYKTDCITDMDFLEKANGVKKFPRHGDLFREYKLISDSIIRVKYDFPEWIKKVNEIAKDSIFPKYYYLYK